jgi:hypothetical protein
MGFGRNTADFLDSGRCSMQYGFGMTATVDRLKIGLFVLIAFTAIAMVACGDEEGDFKEDPRNGEQSGGEQPRSNPLDEGFDDPRVDVSQVDPSSAPTDPPEAAPGSSTDGMLPGRMHGDRTHGIWPQVWSQHAPAVQSWEYKVNCGEATSHTEPCFLSDLTSVAVTTPSGEIIELERDFSTNGFSGEITRRWVLYGPEDGDLPVRGDYVFSYSREQELIYEQVVPYDSGVISFPTGVEWKRSGRDLIVEWMPPAEAAEGMTYKAIIWQVEDTPELFISEQFEWDADSGELRDVPMIVGGQYSLNVAIFFDDGYAYSDYVIFEWPEPGDTGY